MARSEEAPKRKCKGSVASVGEQGGVQGLNSLGWGFGVAGKK